VRFTTPISVTGDDWVIGTRNPAGLDWLNNRFRYAAQRALRSVLLERSVTVTFCSVESPPHAPSHPSQHPSTLRRANRSG
jgi:hypothetical protein